jgi:flagellin
MPSIINTNIASLNTQRNLNTSQASLNTSIQRLSSGLRVNSAKDDAAGLAIAERMNAQVRGLGVAARNANDGVSLAQTAEGALGKVGEMVQRIRELAVQSSNATNSAEDRAALQAEVTQLKDEISRVAGTTNFNGTKLLDGSFTSKQFQVGADAGQSIRVDAIADARLTGMGEITSYASTGATVAAGAIAAGAIKINGVDIGAVTAGGSVAAQATAVAAAINAKTAQTGVTASDDGAGKVILTSNLQQVDVTIADAATATASGFTLGTNTLSGTEGSTTAGDMSTLDISSYAGAQEAIRRADSALNQINSSRATLGALQSRFESAVSNILIAAENATAARSRIMDTDFAAETANLTRSQILQQAGNAMLSQANQLPQQVLALLKG